MKHDYSAPILAGTVTAARTRYSIGFQYTDNGQQFDTEAKLTPAERDKAQKLLDQLTQDGEIEESYIAEWKPAQPHENYSELLGEIKSAFSALVEDEEGRAAYPELALMLKEGL